MALYVDVFDVGACDFRSKHRLYVKLQAQRNNARRLIIFLLIILQSLPLLSSDCWLRPVLLCTVSRELRRYGASLATTLAAASEARALRIVELVAGMLDALPADAGESGVELLELLIALANTRERRLYLVVRGIVPRLVQCVARAVACLAQRERDGESAGVSDGATLVLLVRQLTTFSALNGVRALLKSANALPRVLDNYLSLRGLVLQKTPHTDEAAASLLALLNALAEGEPESLMAACVAALARPALDQRAATFVLQQLSAVVNPKKPAPNVMLTLKKAPTQEEYIRGAMTKNPYANSEIGPLMRDVKNKICRTLDLHGFVDDDNGVELLVRNKIIKLHLSVVDVYKSVNVFCFVFCLYT